MLNKPTVRLVIPWMIGFAALYSLLIPSYANTPTAGNEHNPNSCEASLAETTPAAVDALEALSKDCASQCSIDQVATSIALFADNNPTSRFYRGWNNLQLTARRTFVVGTWLSLLLLPNYLLTEALRGWGEVPVYASAAAYSAVNGISSSIAYYFGQIIHERMFSFLTPLSMRIWGAERTDQWASTRGKISEREQLIIDVVAPQILLLEDTFEKAGKLLDEGDIKQAAIYYFEAIHISYSLFKGANLNHVSIVRLVKRSARTLYGTKETNERQLREEILALLNATSDKDLPPGTTRDTLEREVPEVLDDWFKAD